MIALMNRWQCLKHPMHALLPFNEVRISQNLHSKH